MKKKILALLIATSVSASAFGNVGLSNVNMGNLLGEQPVYAATQQYGLKDNIQDGVILHCFDWKYNDIKAELANIADAGFTSVQTSPAQVGVNSGIWYWMYQPLGFYVGTNDLGTRTELSQLCAEADKYGIKVIVDVVANHLAGNHTNIQSDLKSSEYWHTYGQVDNYSNRVAVTTGDLGMQDIKSENTYVQQLVRNYILDLKSLGVDGIRWDAAKHIALPSEGCDFWSTVCTDTGLYHYGEILGNPGASSDSENTKLMSEYTTYMSFTDSSYGQTMREAFNKGTAPTSYGNWTTKGINANKLVYWGETHDTWSNGKDDGYSNEMTQNVIDRAYAMVGSRQSATALYFSRPSSTEKTQIYAGVKGSTHFKSKEVAAVNHFHNAMTGQSEYFVSTNNVAAVCREKGVVIAMGPGSGSVSITNGGSLVKPGTYKDEITGNTFTVTSSTITGTVGSTGIAVVYDWENQQTSTSVTTNQTTNIPTTQASTTIQTTTQTESQYIAYLDLPAGWVEPVYCYIYDSVNGNSNSQWPGTKMTYDTGLGYYKCVVPDNITSPRIIFYSSDTNRYPADQVEGLTMFEKRMLYSNGTWGKYDEQPVTTTAKTTTTVQTTQATTAQTTAVQTTENKVNGPIEVIGQLISSTKSNTISVVWGQNQEQINNLQAYNVYVDGVKKLSEVGCASYDITGVTSGLHNVRITAVLGGAETTGVTTEVTVLEGETETTQIKTIEGGIEINGYQINTVKEGMKTLYSVDSKISNLDVISSGLIYTLEGYATDEQMYIGSENSYVHSFESTKTYGLLPAVISDSDIASSYAMTMRFVKQTPYEWTVTWKVRAYAELSNGSYAYSNIEKFSIYDVAKDLYNNSKMNNQTAHDYLYENILMKVDGSYSKVNYEN